MKTLARHNTKMERALKIYESLLGHPEHRQLCLTAFMKELKHKNTTASTYYALCEHKLNTSQQVVTDMVIASARKIKFSTVKFKPGTSQISRVHAFLKKKDAVAYNDLHGFNKVVRGIQKLGKDLGEVEAA